MLFLLIAETVLSLALLLAFGIFGIGVSGKPVSYTHLTLPTTPYV